jgi:hypothetical protein
MALQSVKEGKLMVKVGEAEITLRYRRPTVEEMLAALALKIPGPESQSPALDLLRGNLELGSVCLLGVGQGELLVDQGTGPEPISSDPASPDFREDWKELVRECFPTLLIALGQHLSTIPSLAADQKKK